MQQHRVNCFEYGRLFLAQCLWFSLLLRWLLESYLSCHISKGTIPQCNFQILSRSTVLSAVFGTHAACRAMRCGPKKFLHTASLDNLVTHPKTVCCVTTSLLCIYFVLDIITVWPFPWSYSKTEKTTEQSLLAPFPISSLVTCQANNYFIRYSHAGLKVLVEPHTERDPPSSHHFVSPYFFWIEMHPSRESHFYVVPSCIFVSHPRFEAGSRWLSCESCELGNLIILYSPDHLWYP